MNGDENSGATTLLLTWLFVPLLLAFFLKIIQNNYYYYKKVYAIPGTDMIPVIGALKELYRPQHEIFDRMRAYSREFYPIYRITLFHVVLVNLVSPQDIEIVLTSNVHVTKSKVYEFLNEWLGTGLLTSTGTKWQTRRKILTPAFHFKILEQFVGIFNEETEQFVKGLEPSIVDVVPHVAQYTLQSISVTAMGSTNLDQKSQQEYLQAVHQMGNIIYRRVLKPWLRNSVIYRFSSLKKEAAKVIRKLHDLSYYVIAEREKKFDLESATNFDGSKRRLAMLDLLLAAKIRDGNINDEGIREEVDTFMFEGHDTTTAGISLLLMLLANNKDAQDKIYEEIVEVLGEASSGSYKQLQELKYTERCIKEGLRLYPSVPIISRYSGEEFTTATGYVIPANASMFIHIYDLHRNPDIYPDPEKFDSDRFLPENVKGRHPFAYVPFSAGPRNCIGQKFAMLEIKALLCGLLKKFVLEAVTKPEEVKFYPDLVLRTKEPIKVKLVPR